MTATIIRLPRTVYGRLELLIAHKRGLDLAGVDWDAAGARAYADWLRNESKRSNAAKASVTDPPKMRQRASPLRSAIGVNRPIEPDRQ